jgi:phospholipid/cholesterol/gamma-HCH transport system substrate-binding protein
MVLSALETQGQLPDLFHDGTAGARQLSVKKLLNERELYTKLMDLSTHLDQVAAGLNAGRGTAGLLLQDRALYENMNRTVTEMRDLLADIRKDPKKYLRVSVSIF